MNMLSFLGETPTIALSLAQKECGEDAIVYQQKKYLMLWKMGKICMKLLLLLKMIIKKEISH